MAEEANQAVDQDLEGREEEDSIWVILPVSLLNQKIVPIFTGVIGGLSGGGHSGGSGFGQSGGGSPNIGSLIG